MSVYFFFVFHDKFVREMEILEFTGMGVIIRACQLVIYLRQCWEDLQAGEMCSRPGRAQKRYHYAIGWSSASWD